MVWTMSTSAKQQAVAEGQEDIWDKDVDVDKDQSMPSGTQSSYPNSTQNTDDDMEGMNVSNMFKSDRLRHANPQSANQHSEGPSEGYLTEGA
ncbi:uncharacterized protein N7482_003616 [Penicillium canariense]|uniref:Uncharacterized protein n=1 Tax=Penicillium canariense TaxID=189055 RepID=A0A9W9I8W2_9EURO|nr:uncharacterized protein N7482_003616 [Penicillium canariense]KAJ5168022.1 hypothetical protein N7482_003616 [Penicillium canariense]